MQRPGVKIHRRPFTGTLADQLQKPREIRPGISLYWLGQAGFVIDTPDLRLLVDPYLSDSLATKYRDTPYSHERMAPAPIHPDDLGHIDYVLCTHHHTDHMDGLTLAMLAERLPGLHFIVPEASRDLALGRIQCDPDRLIPVDAGQILNLGAHASLSAMRSAHETLEQTDTGAFRFLSFGLNLNGLRLFHSGDTIPFAGQEDEIRSFDPDILLLPVNGRSGTMLAAGFAGNFTLDEAIDLAGRIQPTAMIAHHYGMFAFNTVPPEAIDSAAETAAIPILRAIFKMEFIVTLS